MPTKAEIKKHIGHTISMMNGTDGFGIWCDTCSDSIIYHKRRKND